MAARAHDRRAARSRRRLRFPPLLRRSAQLTVLTGFALAQPLFDILGRNATFFVARRSTGLEIVLLALALTFLPTLVLILAELGAGLVSPRLAHGLHLFFIGALVMLVALQALKKLGLLSGSTPLLVVSALLGAVALLLYAEARAVHTFLAVLSPAPLLFLALFLGTSDVSKLISQQEEQVRTVKTGSQTPVVVVIFDEFSTIALMNEKQQIDRERYPNFAALAQGAIWYRSATGVHTHSESAVPAILTGQLPEKGLLPTFADHPNNIFTLFGGDHRLHVFESLTRLCPRSLCRKSTGAPQASSAVQGGTKSLVSDVSVVYLHLLLPRGLEHRVAPIGEAWGNFRGLRQKSASTSGGLECARGLCDFIRALRRDSGPSLYLVHTLLPHVPWTYLPSGKRYTGRVREIPGAEEIWRRDYWLTVQAYQRYLLQLAYTDRELGLVLDRLRSEGLYDRTVVVVTADHGLSFRSGEPRRHATRGNLVDVAFVPLFVKLPGQKQGQVVDGYARTIDILPTIARAAHTRIPWRVDGRPLRPSLAPDGQVSLVDKDGKPVSVPLSTLLTERRAALARQIAVFGTGSRERLYRIGPYRRLLGKRVLGLAAEPTDLRVEIDQAQLLNTVDLRSEIIPAYVTGRIQGGSGQGENLAVALNGTIVATTRTYDDSGEERFAALVPERMLHTGSNPVDLFGVSGTNERPVLQRLRASSSTLVILKRDGREVIETDEGAGLGIVSGALSGKVHAVTPGESVILGGWAADLDGQQAADSVAVFLDGRSVLVLPVYLRQQTIEDRYGIQKTGFRAELPKRLLPAWGQGYRLRILALRGDVASELRYEGGYLRSGRPR
ncbi:MAG: sulfatase-like hydrolase/transferase [Actinomycetota bacterium]